MRNRILVPMILTFLAVSIKGQQLSLDAMIDRDLASLLSTYKTLHAAPELSHREEKTAFIAALL